MSSLVDGLGLQVLLGELPERGTFKIYELQICFKS